MTEDEIRKWMPELTRAVRGYVDWRQRELEKVAAANGTTPAEEAAEMRDDWLDALSSVGAKDALEVCRRIRRNGVVLPPFGQLPHFVRAEAFAISRERMPSISGATREGRYRCPHCHDSPLVPVVNMRWVDYAWDDLADGVWITEPIAELLGDDWQPIEAVREAPAAWFRRAKDWCRGEKAGPIYGVMACVCDAASCYRQSINNWRDGLQGQPAVRAAFNPETMAPMELFGSAGVLIAATKWVRSHDRMESHAWNPAGYALADQSA